MADSPFFFGYAAVFYSADNRGTQYELAPNIYERLAPGCFDAALQRGDDCRALVDHNSSLLLGRTKSGTCQLSVDHIGLRYRITPLPDDPLTIATADRLRRGDLDGSSFSFQVDDEDWEEKGDLIIRTIRSVSLFDISIVCYPAYTASTAGLARSTTSRRELLPAPRPRLSPTSLDILRKRLQLAEATLN